MQVTTGMLGECANEVVENMVDKNGTERRVRIVPTPICSMQYIRNASYLEVYAALE